MVVHQPTSDAFNLMDHVIFLRQGRAMYQGPGKNLANALAKTDFAIPDNYNPADWMMQVAFENTEEQLEKSGLFALTEEEETATQRPSKQFRRLSVFDTLEKNERADYWTEYRMLVIRELRKIFLNSRITSVRLGVILFGAVVHAIAFAGIGEDSTDNVESFQSHVGALFFLSMAMMFVMMLSLIDVEETVPLFLREFLSSHYRMIPYMAATLTSEFIITIIQALIFVPTVYYTMQLNGSLWNWLGVCLLFTEASIGMAQVVGGLCKDPKFALELSPVLLLPPVLFSGIMVATESLPDWLQWLQVVFPFTYFLRIVFADEFSSCLDFNDDDQHIVNCVQSARQALAGLTPGSGNDLTTIYDENSVLRLAQGGVFTGASNIFEYQGFVSAGEDPWASLWRDCALEGKAFMQLNHADANTCDVTLATIDQTLLNQDRIQSSLKDTSWLHFVFGQRIKFSYTEDLSSITFMDHDLYYPSDFVGTVVGSNEPEIVREDICNVMQDRCLDIFEQNNFTSTSDCVDAMSSLPPVTVNSQGLATIDGNSLHCRNLHANLASQNLKHCPHLSLKPIPDDAGKLICQEEGENNASVEDLFTERDLSLFEHAAHSFGLDGKKQFKILEKDADLLQCSDEFLDSSAIGSVRDVPNTLFCAEFLRSRSATGVNDTSYWLILVGMFVVFRFTAFGLLRLRAHRG